MKKYLIGILLMLCTLPSMGGTGKGSPISTEQEQQFTYYWYAARHALDAERYAEAYVLLQFCRELNPQDAQTCYYLGLLHRGMRQNEQADACFEQAYRLAGKHAPEELLEQLKSLAVHAGQWERAITIQDALDARNGYDAMSAITRYRIYAMANQPKKAIKAIDTYLKTDPDDLRFLLFRLELMEQTGAKQKELYAMYERVLALDPYNLMVLNNYAYHLATHGGDLNEAERMSAVTLREAPSNPVYLDTYGWIMYLKGEKQLALFYLNRALWNAKDEKNKDEIKKHIDSIK